MLFKPQPVGGIFKSHLSPLPGEHPVLQGKYLVPAVYLFCSSDHTGYVGACLPSHTGMEDFASSLKTSGAAEDVCHSF